MQWLRRVIGGVHALVRRQRVERELDEELHAYLEASVSEKMRAGMEKEDAMRAARLEIGSLEAVKDRTRDVGWENRFENLWMDVRYAVRTLRKSPAFTVVAVLTLALGIGANTALFTIVDQVLLRLLPVNKPRELVSVTTRGSFHGDTWGEGIELSYPMYAELRDRNQVFAGMFARFSWEVQVRFQSRANRILAEYVTGSYFPVLGINAAGLHRHTAYQRNRHSHRFGGAAAQHLMVGASGGPRGDRRWRRPGAPGDLGAHAPGEEPAL